MARESVRKAQRNQKLRGISNVNAARDRLDTRPLRSDSKRARKLRKDAIEEEFGSVPIR